MQLIITRYKSFLFFLNSCARAREAVGDEWQTPRDALCYHCPGIQLRLRKRFIAFELPKAATQRPQPKGRNPKTATQRPQPKGRNPKSQRPQPKGRRRRRMVTPCRLPLMDAPMSSYLLSKVVSTVDSSILVPDSSILLPDSSILVPGCD